MTAAVGACAARARTLARTAARSTTARAGYVLTRASVPSAAGVTRRAAPRPWPGSASATASACTGPPPLARCAAWPCTSAAAAASAAASGGSARTSSAPAGEQGAEQPRQHVARAGRGEPRGRVGLAPHRAAGAGHDRRRALEQDGRTGDLVRAPGPPQRVRLDPGAVDVLAAGRQQRRELARVRGHHHPGAQVLAAAGSGRRRRRPRAPRRRARRPARPARVRPARRRPGRRRGPAPRTARGRPRRPPPGRAASTAAVTGDGPRYRTIPAPDRTAPLTASTAAPG